MVEEAGVVGGQALDILIELILGGGDGLDDAIGLDGLADVLRAISAFSRSRERG